MGHRQVYMFLTKLDDKEIAKESFGKLEYSWLMKNLPAALTRYGIEEIRMMNVSFDDALMEEYRRYRGYKFLTENKLDVYGNVVTLTDKYISKLKDRIAFAIKETSKDFERFLNSNPESTFSFCEEMDFLKDEMADACDYGDFMFVFHMGKWHFINTNNIKTVSFLKNKFLYYLDVADVNM